MPTRVFLDTAALIALLNERDALRAEAIGVLADLRSQRTLLVTTEFVLLEVADAFCSPDERGRTITFLDALRRAADIRIIPADTGLWAEGWALFRRRSDKEWGLTDCISFALMAREGITHAFTSDQHFTQAGFIRLLETH